MSKVQAQKEKKGYSVTSEDEDCNQGACVR